MSNNSMRQAALAETLHSIEADPRAPSELREALRELQRQHLELEMQNRTLQEAQRELEESLNRYRELYDFAPMACVSLDEHACIQELNLTGATLLGQDRTRLQGQPFTPFVDPADVNRFLLHVRRSIAGETLSTELRLRIGGNRLDVRLHNAPLCDGARGRWCRTAIVDITELRQMQLRLSLAERLATVGTIAASIAHEINNPLAFLMGSLSLATRVLSVDRALPVEQALTALAEAQSGAERIQGIVKDLSAFARPPENQSRRINVEQVLELSLKMAKTEIQHRARVVRDYAEVPEIVADGALLGQVFLNLLVNAAQAIPEGATQKNEIRLRLRTEEQAVLVQIQDTGEGMPANVVERLFEPFFTTKPVGKGMGLGLAISHSMASQMGGSITVESQPGRGSTFTVRLPAAPPLREAAAAAPVRQSPSAPLRRGKILIVDDEPKFGQTLQLLLSTTHEATYTSRATEALALLQEGRHYDAILCDLMMADVTGKQFYDELLQISPELARRVIFMTGGAYTPASLDFVMRMTNPMLTKPFRVEDLDKLLAPLLLSV
jgi:PAS domain S-box-containing protein